MSANSATFIFIDCTSPIYTIKKKKIILHSMQRNSWVSISCFLWFHLVAGASRVTHLEPNQASQWKSPKLKYICCLNENRGKIWKANQRNWKVYMNVHSVFAQMNAVTALTSFQLNPSRCNLSQTSVTCPQLSSISHRFSLARRDRSVSLAFFFKRTSSLQLPLQATMTWN